MTSPVSTRFTTSFWPIRALPCSTAQWTDSTPPGSTFKPCTAIAALTERKIDTGTIIECEGRYTKYADIGYAPKCWIYGQGLHGELTVSGAITNSCNYFFYTVGDYLQISLMAKYARLFGLGESTGIELYEKTGVMTTDQYMQRKYGRDVAIKDLLSSSLAERKNLLIYSTFSW